MRIRCNNPRITNNPVIWEVTQVQILVPNQSGKKTKLLCGVYQLCLQLFNSEIIRFFFQLCASNYNNFTWKVMVAPSWKAMQTATPLWKKTQKEKEFRLWCPCCTDSYSSTNTHFYCSCFFSPKYLLKSFLLSFHLPHHFSNSWSKILTSAVSMRKLIDLLWRKHFSSIGYNDFILECESVSLT